MNVSLYQAAAAMNANARWQDVIAQNLAVSSIPGARRQQMSFSAVEAALAPSASTWNSSRYVMPTSSTSTSLQQGEFRPTNLPTDVAIQGPGYLQVQLPNGSQAYTRDGELQLSAQGQLVTKQGYTVMGDSGPIQMDPSKGGFSVAATGEVSQGGATIGRIKLLEFNQPGQLTPIGGGCYVANNPQLQSTPAQSSSLRQGFLEMANINPTTEMASLISATRSFEANQKVMQIQDDRLGRTISDLGNPT
jgi:flagellar basal-body rod protein FlgG